MENQLALNENLNSQNQIKQQVNIGSKKKQIQLLIPQQDEQYHFQNNVEISQDNIPIWKKLTVLIGGILVGFNCGLMYLWGIVVVYISSYYRLQGQSISLQTAGIILPVMFLGMALTTPFGIKLMQTIGTRPAILLNGCIFAATIFISSFMLNFGTFTVFYGVVGGFCHGPFYIIALAHNYKFNKNKSLVSGFVAASIGFGTLIFTEVNTAIVNPDNISPSSSQIYFTTTYQQIQVTLKIMVFFRYLALIILCLTVAGSICFLDAPQDQPEVNKRTKNRRITVHRFNPKQQVEHSQVHFHLQLEDMYQGHEEYQKFKKSRMQGYEGLKKIQHRMFEQQQSQKKIPSSKQLKRYGTNQQIENLIFPQQCINIRMAFKSKIFYILFIMIMLGSNMGLFISGNYKNYGHYFIEDTNFLSRIGSIGAIGNGLARIIWGIIMYKVRFRLLYTILLCLIIVLAITFQFVSHINGLFLTYVLLIYCMYAGHYTLFPTICQKIFGVHTGAQVYSIQFMGFALTNFIQFLFGKVQQFNQVIVQTLASQTGFEIVFYIHAGFAVINLFILWIFFSQNYDWKKLNYEYYCKVGHDKYIEQLQKLIYHK